jgi:hypothetical protein
MTYLSAVRLARTEKVARIVDVEAGRILQMANVAGISASPAWVVRDWNCSLSELKGNLFCRSRGHEDAFDGESCVSNGLFEIHPNDGEERKPGAHFI